MNKTLNAVALSLMLAVSAAPAWAHMDHGKPQYGGVVAEAGMAQFEVVNNDGQVLVYATMHGEPLATAGATGKLVILEESRKSELVLQAAGDNRLSAAGQVAKGAKLIVQVQLAGQKMLQGRVVMP